MAAKLIRGGGEMGEGRTWRLLETEPAPGAENMAVDEVLMESVRDGGAPTLRFYRWSPPCLSLGRNQPPPDEALLDDLAAGGVDIVRRPTGGRGVLHDDELTYAVVCSDRELGSPRAAYRLINEVLVEGLSRLGVAVAIQAAGNGPAPRPSTVPCFAEPVAGEVLAVGRKLIGSAQVRLGGVLLQHGSLPFGPGGAAPYVGRFIDPEEGNAPAYLERVLGRPPAWREVVDALVNAWSVAIGPVFPSSLTDEERRSVRVLSERYRRPEWTWRC